VLAGARAVTAQVVEDDGRLLTLKVIKCEILESAWTRLKPLKAGETIRRKRETIITKGLGHRTRWSEEGARDMVVSSFFERERMKQCERAENWRPVQANIAANLRAETILVVL
jgi:hypothetical protein